MTATQPRAVTGDEVQDELLNASPVPPSQVVTPYSFDIHGAAAYVGVSIRTIHYALATGDLTAIKVGKKNLLRRDDLEAWINSKAEG